MGVSQGYVCLTVKSARRTQHTYRQRQNLQQQKRTTRHRCCCCPIARRPEWWYWESILQLETLALVAVEVFGRALVTAHQALLLLAVFLVIGERAPHARTGARAHAQPPHRRTAPAQPPHGRTRNAGAQPMHARWDAGRPAASYTRAPRPRY